MADREDTPMDRVESARRDAVIDRVAPEAAIQQLPARDDAVLPAGERRERVVESDRRTFAAYGRVKVR